MSKGPKSRSYAVGYGKPPAHAQFRKGQSGNPKGRLPTKHGTASGLLRSLLAEKIRVNLNGKQTKMSRLEVLNRKLIDAACQGDFRAFRQVVALLNEGAKNAPLSIDTTVTLVRAHQREDGTIVDNATTEEKKSPPKLVPPIRVKPPSRNGLG